MGQPRAIPLAEWPPDRVDWVLLFNRREGDADYSPDGTDTGVDLTDIAFVPSDQNPNRYYHALQADTLDQALDDWESEFGYSRALERVVKRILTWKQNGAGTKAAARHEQSIKAAFNRDNPVRGVSDFCVDSEMPMEDELPVLEHLVGISRAYIRRHHLTPIPVYRGCKYYINQIAEDLFERPTDSKIRIDTSVLLNVTIDDQIAYQYSPLVLNLDLQPDDVAIAVDHLFWHRWMPEIHSKPSSDGDRYADGELQIFGKMAESFDHNSLEVLGSSPLSELINSLPEDDSLSDVSAAADELGFSVPDHRAIAICLSELSRSGKTLSPGAPRNRIQNWFSILTYDYQDESFEVFNEDDDSDDRCREISVEELVPHVENVTLEAPRDFDRNEPFSQKVKHER